MNSKEGYPEPGDQIHVVEDCCESFTEEMHQFEIQYIIPKFGTVTSSTKIKTEL